jgi:hypothetical protein
MDLVLSADSPRGATSRRARDRSWRQVKQVDAARWQRRFAWPWAVGPGALTLMVPAAAAQPRGPLRCRRPCAYPAVLMLRKWASIRSSTRRFRSTLFVDHTGRT